MLGFAGEAANGWRPSAHIVDTALSDAHAHSRRLGRTQGASISG